MSIACPISPPRSVSLQSIRLERVAGLAGLVFAVIVGAVNVAIGSMSPPAADANGSDIVAFMQENRTLLGVVAAAIPFAVMSLFVFIASAYSRLSSTSPEAAFWTRLGAIGIVLVEVMFLVRMLFEFVLITRADALAQETALVETLWQMSNAATMVTGLALSVALLGLSRAASLAKLIPRWQELLGLAASVLFFVGAVSLVPSLEGSPIGIVGLPAFVGWLVWLALTSIRLLRTEGDAA